MCVCLSVPTLVPTSLVFYVQNEVHRGLSRIFCFLIRGFSINHSIQKLWREEANMQITMYLSRAVLACFEYRACISTYVKGKHCVSERYLARL